MFQSQVQAELLSLLSGLESSNQNRDVERKEDRDRDRDREKAVESSSLSLRAKDKLQDHRGVIDEPTSSGVGMDCSIKPSKYPGEWNGGWK